MSDKTQAEKTSKLDKEGDGEPIVDLAITMPRLIALSKTPTVPDRYFGKPGDMVAAIWYGRELGLEPMEAIASMYVVNGSVSMSSKAMSALIHRAGHRISVSMSNDEAVVECFRWSRFEKEMVHVGTVKFDRDDAKQAGLTSKDTYRDYPQIMLAWRAISLAARVYYADVISGVSYHPDEVDVDIDPLEDMPALPDPDVEDAELVGEVEQPLGDDVEDSIQDLESSDS